MKFLLALKAFIHAWKNPEKAEQFLNDTPKTVSADNSHLRLLAMLQHSGRLVDFFKEDVTSFSDAQIGAAARKIHEDCSKSIEELITIRPLMQENEGAAITVPAGYDPKNIKIIGKIKGTPPFTGILLHKGWKAHKRSLPKKIYEDSSDVICPAEVEIK